MIRKYYIDDDTTGGGGGGGATPPTAPKGYTGISPQVRQDWNNFLDYLDKKGVAGKAELDKRDQSLGLNYLKQYKKENPNSSLTADLIPHIQYDQYLLRKGDSYPGLSPEQLKYVRNGLSPAYIARTVSDTDGWLGSLTSKQYYPTAKRGTKDAQYDFGTNIEDYVNSLQNPDLASKYKLQPPPNMPAGHGPPDIGITSEQYNNAPIANNPGSSSDVVGDTKVVPGLAPTASPSAEISAAAPSSTPALAINAPSGTGADAASTNRANVIPRPDYNDQASRNNFLKQWAKKYGDLQGRGDTILKLNEVPRGGHSTEEVIATNAAKKFGIDPALLHVSAFEEGASELFKDKSGLDTKHRKPTDFGYMGDYGDKEFPINGNNSFGLPDFTRRFPDLVAGGYLPKSFQSQFRGTKKAGEFGENNFKSVEDAMTAKAALMKFGSDYVDKIATKNGVELSPKQKDFFTLAWFNGGEGAVLSRIPQYKAKGYLKDDSFLDKRPKEEMGKPDNLDVWGHVVPRIKRRDALIEQKFFQSKS